MKVEFTIDEVVAMASTIVDGVLEAKLERKDAASIRRWRNDVLTAKSAEMKLLTEKVNRGLEQTQASNRKTGIVKPDWA